MRRPFTVTSAAVPSSSVEAAEIARVPALRERIAPACEVVIPEHGERTVAGGRDELGGRRCEPRSGPAARHEVTGHGDEVGLELGAHSTQRRSSVSPGP